MMIAALSGLRLEEIFQLTVGDCANGYFNVRNAKTSAGERLVPIHDDLADIIARRCKDKTHKDYLIHEAKAASRGATRSMAFSKRFATYRKACDVDFQIEGRRLSLINFHSLRICFSTQVDQAGHRNEDIARVMGHEVQGMSLGLYSGGPTVGQLKAVVASVRLPKEISHSKQVAN